MKKKMTKGQIVIVVIVVILACAVIGKLFGKKEPSQSASATTEAVAKHVNTLTSAKVKTKDVKNGSKTEVLGQRAYIEVKKADLKSITEEDYAEFCKECVDGKDYQWMTIICDDGTGIQFTGCAIDLASYGKVDDEGRVEPADGYIKKNASKYEYVTK